MRRSRRSVCNRDGHVTMETVYGQTLTLRLGDGDEHHALKSDMTGLNVKGNLYLYHISPQPSFLKAVVFVVVLSLSHV